MPNDNKGGGLDDLKARLGLDGVLKKKQAQPTGPAKASGLPGRPSRLSGTPGSQRSPGQLQPGLDLQPGLNLQPGLPQLGGREPEEEILPPPPNPDDEPSGNYAVAVSTFEEPVAGEGDPAPVHSATFDAIDPNIVSPIAKGTRTALIVVAAVILVVASFAAFTFGKVMRDRIVSNKIIEAADAMLAAVDPIATRVNDLSAQLAAFDSFEYSSELHGVLQEFCAGGGPTLDIYAVTDGRVLMTTGEDLARQVLTYSTQTQILSALCEQHLRLTIRDNHLIERLTAELQEVVNYAVLFDSGELVNRLGAYYETPDDAPYIPVQGAVVTYEELAIAVEGEAEVFAARSHSYTVMIGGTTGSADIYNLVTIEADQLQTNANEETALDRFRRRVSAIREQLDQVLVVQLGLRSSLEEQSRGQQVFTL